MAAGLAEIAFVIVRIADLLWSFPVPQDTGIYTNLLFSGVTAVDL